MSCLFSAIGPTHVIPKDRLRGPFWYLQIVCLSICPNSNRAFDITKSTPPKHVLFSFYVYLRHPPKTKQKRCFNEKSSQSTKFPQQKNLRSSTSQKNSKKKQNPSNNFHSFRPKLLMNLIPSGHHLSFPHRRRRRRPTAAGHGRYRRHPRRRGTRRRWRCWRVCGAGAIGNSTAEEP